MKSAIIKKAKELSIPTKQEKNKIKEISKEILNKVNAQLKKDKIKAKLIIGGSVAKGTWLPGISDIDFFLQFNYKKYQDKSAELDDITEKILRKCFETQEKQSFSGELNRLHGSRDYFSLEKNGFYIEIVPVLKITKPEKAKNITDASPLHINWVKKKTNPKLIENIRLAKQFFRANKLYGAESYIRGFSGHVIEILVIHYGSFEKLIKAISKWAAKKVIDTEKRYKSSSKVLKELNPSKTKGPLIIIDPIESGRNAAAALSKRKFDLAVKVCKKFLAKPNISFFKEKPVTIKALIAKKRNRKLVILSAKTKRKKVDIAGAKLMKKFEIIKRKLKQADFKISDCGWYWDEKSPALFWFYFPKKALPKTKIHWGPPAKLPEQFIKAFKKKWKKKKVKKKKGKYYVELKRKFTKPENFLKNLVKQIKNVQIVRYK